MLIRQSQSVTINIIYYRIDYSSILQEFVWNYDDIIPELQRTHKFLWYWKNNIDAVIKDILLGIDGNPMVRLRAVDHFLTLQ